MHIVPSLARRTEKIIDGVGGGATGCANGSGSGSDWLWCSWERKEGVRASDRLGFEISVCRGRSATPGTIDSKSRKVHDEEGSEVWRCSRAS